MLVRLTKRETGRCEQAATFRWQLARASGVVNQRKDGGRSDGDLDLLGIKAETAVAKLFGISDYNPFEFGIDCGQDMALGDITIDVKATFYKSGMLLFKTKESFKSSTSVLVTATGDDDVFNVVGHCPRSDFMAKSRVVDLGHGAGYAVDQGDLRPIENLWVVWKSMQVGPVRRRETAPPKSSMEPVTPTASAGCSPAAGSSASAHPDDPAGGGAGPQESSHWP